MCFLNIPRKSPLGKKSGEVLKHAAWLGCDWQIDAQHTLDALADKHPDWLVVDHYAIDAQVGDRSFSGKIRACVCLPSTTWQTGLTPAINCLDQNLGRKERDYADLVPEYCRTLIGPKYALLRPEFAEWPRIQSQTTPGIQS